MTKHPTSEWEWEETAEVAFQEWFNGEYGNFTFRCEWFFGDCEVEDVNTRKDLMSKWLHSAFLTGYNTGRCSKTMTEYQPTPQTPEQVEEGLRDAMRQAKKDGVFDKPKPTILYDIIADWWDEIFINGNPSGQNFGSLVDTIESEWLPEPDDGGDRYSCGWNDCVEKLRLRLKND